MRLLVTMLAVWAFASHLSGADEAKGKAAPKELQGEWQLSWWSFLGEGGGAITEARAGNGLTITGDKAKWTEVEGALKAGSGTVTVDAAAKPPRIMIKTEKETYKGVYSLKDGYLLITFSAAGKDYPKAAEREVDFKKEFAVRFKAAPKKAAPPPE